jgi:hypothetical protein
MFSIVKCKAIKKKSITTVLLGAQSPTVILTQKYIKWSLNFDLSLSLNSSYWNLMGYKNLSCFEFSKSLFLIFENQL